MKTLADFKRQLKVGVKLDCVNHRLGYGNFGVREVSIVQTNAFALKTTKTDGKVVDSWCQMPKASQVEIKENSITIFEPNREGKPEPILTYTFV